MVSADTKKRLGKLKKKLQAGKKRSGQTVTKKRLVIDEGLAAERKAEIEAFQAEKERRTGLQEQRRREIDLFDIGFQEAQERRRGEQAQFDIDFLEAQRTRSEEQEAFELEFGDVNLDKQIRDQEQRVRNAKKATSSNQIGRLGLSIKNKSARAKFQATRRKNAQANLTRQREILKELRAKKERAGDKPIDLTLEAFSEQRGGARPVELSLEEFGERPVELMFDPLGPGPTPIEAREETFDIFTPGNIRPFRERRKVTRAALTQRKATKRKPGRKTRKVATRRRGGATLAFDEPFSLQAERTGLF